MSAVDKIKFWELTPEEARKAFRELCRLMGPDGIPIGDVEDRNIPGPAGAIRLRIYSPQSRESGSVPGVLYYHGGGFIVGGLESYDPVCRSLCNASGCRLIAVDYRLAPEHKFPAALADAEAAWDWVASHRQEIGVTERIGVAGDSSGGNLAAVLAQCRRSRGPELAFQLLAYPMVTMRDRPASERVPLIGPLVDLATIALVRKRYVPADADLSDPRLAPENVDDLCGLPPAYVITAGIDPLHDGIVAYVQRLKAAGNSVTHMDYPSMPHGFLNALGIFEQARQAIADAGAAMKNALFVL